MRMKNFFIHILLHCFFSFFISFFFRDRQRSNAIGDLNITRSAFWKKRTKNFFDHYSLFQQRIKCIRTNHSKCDILWLIFRWHWWRWWWGTCWRFCYAFSLGTFPIPRFFPRWWWTWRTWWQGTIPLALDWFSMYIFFYTIHILSLVIEIYDWKKKIIYEGGPRSTRPDVQMAVVV